MKNLQNQVTVLLIENNSNWLIDSYSTLQEAGYDVMIANGGSEGFCLARRVRPDLIISATALPDISGIELCCMIRADKYLNTALFVLIGELDAQVPDASAEAFEAGTDDFFYENCNPQFLKAKVARLIELRRSENEIRFGYQNLHRSEQHLAQLIEDTSRLIASIDPQVKNTAAGKLLDDKSKSFFDRNHEPNKQKAEKPLSSLKKNDDPLAAWKQLLQVKNFEDAEEFGGEKFGKVYYEIPS